MNFLFYSSTRNRLNRAKKVFARLDQNLASAETLLNVGCGDGYLENLILKKYPRIEITGTDTTISPKYPTKALQGTIVELEENNKLPKRYFDIIVLSLSLHHLDNPLNELKILSESLKDPGIFFILEIAPKSNFLKKLLFDTRILCLKRKHSWNTKELFGIIQQAGLKIKNTEIVPIQSVIIYAQK